MSFLRVKNINECFGGNHYQNVKERAILGYVRVLSTLHKLFLRIEKFLALKNARGDPWGLENPRYKKALIFLKFENCKKSKIANFQLNNPIVFAPSVGLLRNSKLRCPIFESSTTPLY